MEIPQWDKQLITAKEASELLKMDIELLEQLSVKPGATFAIRIGPRRFFVYEKMIAFLKMLHYI